MSVKKVGQDESATRRTTCRNCGSILEYLPVDVKEETRTDYTGGSDTYRFISCPECNQTVYVK